MEQWAADIAAPREQLGVRCLAQGSHLSRRHFLPELGFKPTTLDTSGFKSNALSIRLRQFISKLKGQVSTVKETRAKQGGVTKGNNVIIT